MTVYVDDMKIPFRDMEMCHMMADSTDELLRMADAIGMRHEWIQYPGTAKEHFDISQQKRLAAINLGAIPVSRRALVRIIRQRKSQPGNN